MNRHRDLENRLGRAALAWLIVSLVMLALCIAKEWPLATVIWAVNVALCGVWFGARSRSA